MPPPRSLPKLIGLYLISFVGLGLVNASLGPSLPHLAQNTGVTLAVISSIFAAYRGGYLVGSFWGGRLFDRLPGNTLLAVLLMGLGVGAVLIPATARLWVLLTVFAILGVMGGAVDVGGNVLLVWLEPPRLGSLMSILHLSFGIGAFLSPVFLVQSLRWSGTIHWGYWGIMLLLVVPGLLLLRQPSPDSAASVEGQSGQGSWLLPLLMICLLLLYVGAEASFGGWIYTYAVRRGVASEIRAGYLTSLYWGAYSLGRLSSAGASLRVRPGGLLRTGLIGALVSLALLLIFRNSIAAVWIGTALFGFFMGPVFPTALIYANNIFRLTGSITGLFLVGSSLGSVAVPWTIGQLFETVGPGVVIVIILVVMVLASGVSLLVPLAARRAS